jgi:hypothetical protein
MRADQSTAYGVKYRNRDHEGATSRECDMIVGRIWGAIADIIPVDVDAYAYKQAYRQIQKIVKDGLKV